MRRIFTLITIFIVFVGIVFASSLSIYGAIEEPQLYELTVEETIALINSSNFSLVVGYDDDTNITYSGGAYTAFSFSSGGIDFIGVRLPNTRQLSNKTINSVSVTFPLSLTIRGLTDIYFPVSIGFYYPSSITSLSGFLYPKYDYCHFQLDNTSNPVGSKVVFSGYFPKRPDSGYSVTAPTSRLFYDDSYSYFFQDSNGLPLYYTVDGTFCISGRVSNASYRVLPLSVSSTDVDTIGYEFHMFNSANTTDGGLVLCFPCLSFTAQSWSSGGGSTDPDNPSGGFDYKEQLDDIYNELVKQGKIQQAQNDAILQGQKDIEDSINNGFGSLDDTLKNLTPEQSSQVSENQSVFESQQSELHSQLEDIEVTLAPEDEELMTSMLDDIGSVAGEIDPTNHLSIWSVVYAFFDDIHAGGILITVSLLLWAFVIIKALLYGVHT